MIIRIKLSRRRDSRAGLTWGLGRVGVLLLALLRVVGDQVGQRAHVVALLVEELHRVLEARLQGCLVFLEHPHHDSPADRSQQVIAVPLLNEADLALGEQGERSQLPVEEGGESDCDPAEQVEHDLVVHACPLAENERSEDEAGEEVVERVGRHQSVEQLVPRLVAGHEQSQVLAVLEGHGAYILEKCGHLFERDVPEEEGHDEGVDEAYLAAVLEAVPQPFEKGVDFLLEMRHVLLAIQLMMSHLQRAYPPPFCIFANTVTINSNHAHAATAIRSFQRGATWEWGGI